MVEYRKLSKTLVKSQKKLILYMNFKSHNILDTTKRNQLFNIIKNYKPDIICLSEALLPISINNNKKKFGTYMADIVQIDTIVNDIITQPYKSL